MSDSLQTLDSQPVIIDPPAPPPTPARLPKTDRRQPRQCRPLYRTHLASWQGPLLPERAQTRPRLAPSKPLYAPLPPELPEGPASFHNFGNDFLGHRICKDFIPQSCVRFLVSLFARCVGNQHLELVGRACDPGAIRTGAHVRTTQLTSFQPRPFAKKWAGPTVGRSDGTAEMIIWKALVIRISYRPTKTSPE
jgi:hypothetical protein